MVDRLTPAMRVEVLEMIWNYRSTPGNTLVRYLAELRDEAARREAEAENPEVRELVREWKADAPPPPAPDDLVRGLRDRARHARAERNAIATRDAWHFEQAADAIEALRAERDALLSDWNEMVLAIGASKHGTAIAHAATLKADAKRLREVVKRTAECGTFTADLRDSARAALAQGGNDDQGK